MIYRFIFGLLWKATLGAATLAFFMLLWVLLLIAVKPFVLALWGLL